MDSATAPNGDLTPAVGRALSTTWRGKRLGGSAEIQLGAWACCNNTCGLDQQANLCALRAFAVNSEEFATLNHHVRTLHPHAEES